MSELMQLFGVGNSLTWRGKTYELAPYTWKLRARFQAWLNDQAFRQVEAGEGQIDPVRYQKRLHAMAAVVGSKTFEAGNEAFMEASKSLEGRAYEVYLRINSKDSTFTPEMALEMVAEMWDEIAVKLQLQETDPNPTQAERTASPSLSAP